MLWALKRAGLHWGERITWGDSWARRGDERLSEGLEVRCKWTKSEVKDRHSLAIKATLSPNVTGSTCHIQNSAADFASGGRSSTNQGSKTASRVECRTESVLPKRSYKGLGRLNHRYQPIRALHVTLRLFHTFYLLPSSTAAPRGRPGQAKCRWFGLDAAWGCTERMVMVWEDHEAVSTLERDGWWPAYALKDKNVESM